MDWKRSSWDITISNKKIFFSSDLCRSLGEHASIHGDDDAGTVELSQTNDVALQTFLSITVLAEYKQHYDCRMDIEFDASTGHACMHMLPLFVCVASCFMSVRYRE